MQLSIESMRTNTTTLVHIILSLSHRLCIDQHLPFTGTFLNQANAFNAELHACTASQGPVPFHQPEDRSAGPSTFYQRDDQAIPSVAYVSPSGTSNALHCLFPLLRLA